MEHVRECETSEEEELPTTAKDFFGRSFTPEVNTFSTKGTKRKKIAKQ